MVRQDDPHDTSPPNVDMREWYEDHAFKGEKRDPPGSGVARAVILSTLLWLVAIVAALWLWL